MQRLAMEQLVAWKENRRRVIDLTIIEGFSFVAHLPAMGKNRI